MKIFKFNLDTLLKIRKIEEDKMLKELSKITAEINQVNQQIEENLKKIQENQLSTNNFQEYKYKNNFFNTLFAKNKNLKNKLKSFSEQLEFHRSNFIQAKQKKKIIELLKENKYQEFKKKYRKKEEMELEEYYLQSNID